MEAKVILILAAAGGAAYLLTRKSGSSETPAPAAPALARPPNATITKVALPPLDSGLSDAEKSAIQTALSLETRADNLRAFADTFDPVFPLAAKVLRNQADAMQGARTSGEEPCCDGCADGSRPPCAPHVTGPAIRIGLPKSIMGGS